MADVKVYIVNLGRLMKRSDKSSRNHWFDYDLYNSNRFGFKVKDIYYVSTLADAIAQAKGFVENGDFDSYGVDSATYRDCRDIDDEGGVENLPIDEDEDELLLEDVVYSVMNSGGIVKENFLDD